MNQEHTWMRTVLDIIVKKCILELIANISQINLMLKWEIYEWTKSTPEWERFWI